MIGGIRNRISIFFTFNKKYFWIIEFLPNIEKKKRLIPINILAIRLYISNVPMEIIKSPGSSHNFHTLLVIVPEVQTSL